MTVRGVDVVEALPAVAFTSALVPFDGSETSKAGLLVADELADRLGLEIYALYAVPREADVPEGRRRLSTARLSSRPVYHTLVVDPDPANAICQALASRPSSVLCIGSHGRGRSAALVGSVSRAVMARTHRQAVLAGPSLGRPGGIWWEDDPVCLSRYRGGGVVACLGDMETAPTLLHAALRWAKQLGETLIAITVAEPVPRPLDEGPVHRAFGPADVDEFLAQATVHVREKGVDVVCRPIYDPISPAEGVYGYLKEAPGALAVAGWRPRPKLPRLVSKATTANIVRSSPSPVLVVPLDGDH
jgi:nucleotide-binding universal stress UspA family protein